MPEQLTIGAIAPWFGSNRMLGPHVGKALKGCSWVGIPFAGSMAEVPHIEARTVLVNDLHRNVINLAACMAHPDYGPKLYRRLRRPIFHPEELEEARFQVRDPKCPIDIDAAHAYFVAVWMGRSAKAGTDDEFKGKLSIRWTASGGDSATRYHNAVKSIPAWRRTLRRCSFSTLDALEFLGKCKDESDKGIYCDPPFPGPGDDYKHTIDEAYQRRLAKRLSEFTTAKVVCRFYDHPLVRELYPEPNWTWNFLDGGKTQANKETNEAPEVLLCNRP